MNSLISLDLANQETFQDSKHALSLLFSPRLWSGDTVRSLIKTFLIQSSYVPDANTQGLQSALFFSGRAALRLLLSSLELSADSLVAIQAFTCAAVVLPIFSANLRPVYIDITPTDFSMNIEDLRRKYTDNIKVLILQHSFGITPVKRDEIIQFCKEHGIFLIEDLAHGYLPQTLTAPADTSQYAALVSFGRSKLLSSVFGAGIITPDTMLAQNLTKLASDLSDPPSSLVLRCLLYKILLPLIKLTYPIFIGRLAHRLCIILRLFPREMSSVEERGRYDGNYEYKYPEVLANTVKLQIDRLPVLLDTINRSVEDYTKYLPHVTSFPTIPLNRFPYLLPKYSDRSHILRHFKKLDILLGSWYDKPVGPEKVDLDAVQYIRGSCPNAEDITKRIINLPTNVKEEDARLIVQELKNQDNRNKV